MDIEWTHILEATREVEPVHLEHVFSAAFGSSMKTHTTIYNIIVRGRIYRRRPAAREVEPAHSS